MKRLAVIIAILITVSVEGFGVDIPRESLQKIDSMVTSAVKRKYIPGASVLIGDRNKVIMQKNYGYHDFSQRLPVTDDDLYDIASCTKVVATTFAVMRLYDRDSIDINAPVGKYIHVYDGTPVASIRITELLTHTSGLRYKSVYTPLLRPGKPCDPAYICCDMKPGYRQVSASNYVNPAYDTVIRKTIIGAYDPSLRGKYRYNDFNFSILKEIIESITLRPFDSVATDLFGELDMGRTGFNPMRWCQKDRIVPTEMDTTLRHELVQGYVHDEFAALEGGVSGHAGVFSTASDLSNFCRMMVNRGRFDGRKIISERTIYLFTSSTLQYRGVYRGLGFDKRNSDSIFGTTDSFGHFGFTGTMIWMDRQSGLYAIFLSNRVNPTRDNRGFAKAKLRANIWEELLKGEQATRKLAESISPTTTTAEHTATNPQPVNNQ